jgi:hypothetical protein
MRNAPNSTARRRWLKRFVAVLALLPCLALVSCKAPKLDKVKFRTDGQAVEPKKITGAAAPLRPDPSNGIFTIWKFSMMIDGPNGANVVEAIAANKKGSYIGTVVHEEDKCTISWEAPKNDFAFTASFNIVLSCSDGNKMEVAYKEYITALGWATLIVGAVLMNPIVLAPLF